jgi:hypothetical protein
VVLGAPFIGRHGEQGGGRCQVIVCGGDSMESSVSWSKKGEESRQGAEPVRGKGKQPSGASIHLLTRKEGRSMATHGAAVPVEGGGGSVNRRKEKGPGGLAYAESGPCWPNRS